MIIVRFELRKTHMSMTLTFALEIILSGRRHILSLSVTTNRAVGYCTAYMAL